MGDPLSVAAGITGLISFASDLAGICFDVYQYGKSVKNAPQAAREVRDQLSGLRRVLLDLEELYSTRTEDLPHIENIVCEVNECKACLESFKRTVDPKVHGLKRVVDRFLFPTRKDEISDFLRQIESQQRRFEAAKANDGILLTTKVLGVQREVLGTVQKVEQHQRDHGNERLLNWLSHLEFGQLQTDRYIHRRQRSTCTWILKHPRYVQWRDYAPPTASGLLCTGDPGAGKSITCSVVVKDLSKLKGVGFAYAYCLHQERGVQSPEALLGAVAKQLLRADPQCMSMAREFFETWKHETTPRVRPMIQLIYNICQTYDKAYLVFDGLDELVPGTLQALLGLFTKLKNTNIHFLVFSRAHNAVINKAFEAVQNLHVEAQEQDIRAAIKGWIDRDLRIQSIGCSDKTFEGRIAAGIARKSAGLFGLAQRHIVRVSQETCQKDMLDRLIDLEETLEEEFASSLDRIKLQPEPQRKLAFRILYWLSYALSALTCEQILEALAISRKDTKLQSGRKPSLQDVLGVCVGLVTVNAITSTLDLFHYTLKEFLLLDQGLFDGMLGLGESCLLYLNYDDFDTICPEDWISTYRYRNVFVPLDDEAKTAFWTAHPFAKYASNFWADHIRGSEEVELQPLILGFLRRKNILSALRIGAMVDTESDSRKTMMLGSSFDEIEDLALTDSLMVYLCTCFRLEVTLRKLLSQGAPTDFRASWGANNTPLHVAIMQQDEKIFEALIKAKADVNVPDKWGLTPLHLDVRYNSHTETSFISPLLTAGADPNLADQDGRTVLQLAVRHAGIQTIEAILPRCDVDIQDQNGDTALHHAVRLYFTSALTALLAHHANPAITNKQGESSLGLAVAIESYQMTQQLLHAASLKNGQGTMASDEQAARDYLAKVDAQSEARKRAYQEKEQQRLESRRTFNHRTPVSDIAYAAEKGEYGALKRLVGQGADVNKQDPATGRTALHHAALGGRENAIRFLRAAGADPHICDHEGLTAMDLALRYAPQVAHIIDHPVIKHWLTHRLTDMESA